MFSKVVLADKHTKKLCVKIGWYFPYALVLSRYM